MDKLTELTKKIEDLYAERDTKIVEVESQGGMLTSIVQGQIERIMQDYRLLIEPLERKVKHIEITTNFKLANSNIFHGWAMIILTFALVIVGVLQALGAVNHTNRQNFFQRKNLHEKYWPVEIHDKQ